MRLQGGGDVRQVGRDWQLGRKRDADRARRTPRGDDGCRAGELGVDVGPQPVGRLAVGKATPQRGEAFLQRRSVGQQGVVERCGERVPAR